MRKWIAVSALVVLIAPGCTKPQEQDGAGGQTEAQLKPESGDDKILKAVKDKLAADPDLKKEQIDVQVKDGRVTLSGEVSSATIRSKADEMVRDVPDVFGVDAEKLTTK